MDTDATLARTREIRDGIAAAGIDPSAVSEDEWKQRLTPMQYEVLRRKGTERAFTGDLWDHKGSGTYLCAGCATPLFRSDTKYESGCGWPSFFGSEFADAIVEERDTSFGMVRVEVLCKACGGHLGHVFPDGPPPSGIRYCINSASLAFEPDAQADDSA